VVFKNVPVLCYQIDIGIYEKFAKM